MEYFKQPLKIGVIDNDIEPQVLKTLVPYYLGKTTIVSCGKADSAKTFVTPGAELPFHHSTLCTALLIESLYEKNVLDRVQIVNLSISDELGKNTFQGLENALDYCISNNFNIVSVSIGVLNLLYARRMLPLLKSIKSTIIVSAASNDFTLTYPAAFSTVIGVKRATHEKGIGITVVKNPTDGIELVISYTETSILSRLRKEYQLNCEYSNSILVPRVCAEIAGNIIKNKGKLTKHSVLRTFMKNSDSSVEDQGWDIIFRKNPDDSIPVVLFQYDRVNQSNQCYLLKRLQETFEANGYSCSILCDCIVKSDFENGWYKTDPINIGRGIEYYLNVISDGVLFLLLYNEIAEGFYYDMSFEEEVLPHYLNEQGVNILYSQIIESLS